MCLCCGCLLQLFWRTLKYDIYVLTDYDRWCDRKNTKLNPPFFFWQKLKIETDDSIAAVSWCEELSYSESDCWLAAASSESVYLFAASKEQDDQVSILPVWRFVRKVEVFKRGCIRTLSWSSCFGVRKLLVGGKKLNLYVVTMQMLPQSRCGRRSAIQSRKCYY